MTMTMEHWKILLQTLQLLAVIVGLAYTARQLRIVVSNYRDLHDWNRRKSAQDAVDCFSKLAEGNKLINDAFDYLNNNDPIPLEQIQGECNKTNALRSAIHRLLNTFDAIALGLRHGVYDEAIVKEALQDVMSKAVFQFSAYIQHRRGKGGDSQTWIEVETLVKKWADEDCARKKRPETGNA